MKKLLLASLMVAVMVAGVGMLALAEDDHQAGFNITISDIHLVHVTGDPTSFVVSDSGIAAGAAPNITGADSTSKLQYTSIVTDTYSRTITAALGAAESVPTGLTLTLVAVAPTGTGTVGSAADAITLTDTGAQAIITAIGSCYTGAEVGDGVQLTYTLAIATPATDMATVKITTATALTVNFVITEEAL